MKKLIFILPILILIGIGCSEKQDTLDVPTHPNVWMEKDAAEFHGNAVLETGTESCKSCHGANFQGEAGAPACATCHEMFPHPQGFAHLSSPDFHAQYFKKQMNWDLQPCQKCHGANYAGAGEESRNCLKCHTAPAGPEACNTCHGNENNPAPPQDLADNLNSSALGVGAHQAHLNQTDIMAAMDCATCHTPVMAFSDGNHLDTDGQATMSFSTLASDSGRLNPTYDFNTGTCAEVYCHGNFAFIAGDSTIQGHSTPPVWNADLGAAQCEGCHSLPPKGHFGKTTFTTAASCATCHPAVVNPDGTIKDVTKHINGQKDLF